MQFQDIPQFPQANYSVDVAWRYLEQWLLDFEALDLDLDPDFQRGHVWTPAQQTAFVEHMLQGGTSPRNLYWNCIGWKRGIGPMQLIDGKQRLEAARAFMRDEVRVFGGQTCSDLGGVKAMHTIVPAFKMHVHALPSRADVLRWYIAMNRGGSVHSDEEIARVRALLDAELE
jgi:hypothetical protein